VRGRERIRGADAAGARRERRGGADEAKPEAILPAPTAPCAQWLDDWKRWPTLPAVALGNLYTVDANLLHRAGPRFVDGVEMLCATLAEARAGLR
jgi:hypothetical protein